MMKKILLVMLIGIIAFNFIALASVASAYSFVSQPNGAGKDTYINSASTTRNYGADNVIKMTTTDTMRSLIEFNLSDIPSNAVITNAYIELYLSSKGTGASVPVTMQRVNNSWTEGTGIDQVTGDGATWNNRTGSALWTTAGGDFGSIFWANTTVSTQDLFYDWNITQLAQSWVNGTYPNYGVVLRILSGNGNWQFASGDNTNATIRPKIVVNYTLPLNITFVSPTPNNASTVNGSSVYVNASITNGNASSAKLEWTNGGSTNYTMSNNTGSNWYYNITNLTNGNYTYKVYANDSDSAIFYVSALRTVTVSYCTANMTNTSWSGWANLTCSGNQKNQSRSLTQYDANNCGASNTTFYEYQLVGPTYMNTSWSDWINTTCSGTQMNQSRNLTQYDIYGCAANSTVFSYQLIGPSYQNTSWSDWINISCLSNDKMNQSRNLTQYDSYSCAANSTITEYRQTETCDYCAPNLMNTTWGAWYNITACMPGDYYTQEKNATQYDSNNCGEIANSTVYDYQNLSCTYNKLPVVTTPSITPATAYTNDDLNCSFTVTDEDADSLSVNYTWYNGTNAVISGSMSVTNGTEVSVILEDGNTTKNEVWNCSINPYDTKDYGNRKSTTRTISNSLPTAPTVDVIPDAPSDNEDLVATIATASTDLDNDTITYSYQWYKNDALQVGQTFNTLSKSLTSIGEVWKCIVTPNDGTGNGATGSDNVTIVSSDTTPPAITIVNPANGTSLSTGTTETWINITTNENATCRYSNTSSAFSFDEGTDFTTTGNSAHSFLFSGMSDGQTYHLYYKCNDTSGNVNPSSTTHTFSVLAAPYCGDGSCNNGETCSSCSADCGSCGGGGGGGGSKPIIKNNTIQNNTNISQPVSPSQQLVGCNENWNCGNWTECSTDGLQVRACNDANNCGTTISKPSEIQSCARPTCFDGVQNQEELGIDCGGPCAKRCGIGQLSGQIVQVPSPEKTAKSKYGILLIGLLFVLVGMLTMISRMEYRIKGHIRKSHILTHLHEHHHGTQVSPEASHIKEIGNVRLKLLLMNIAHIIIIIVIIGVIYYLLR